MVEIKQGFAVRVTLELRWEVRRDGRIFQAEEPECAKSLWERIRRTRGELCGCGAESKRVRWEVCGWQGEQKPKYSVQKNKEGIIIKIMYQGSENLDRKKKITFLFSLTFN